MNLLQGYEERKYPRLNYACTKMTYDIPRETEPWGVWGVITTLISDNMDPSEPRPQSTMFRRLFRYIRGENRLGQTMEMTTPIWTKLVVSEEVRGDFVVMRSSHLILHCSSGRSDSQHHVCSHHPKVPVQPPGSFGAGGEDCEEQRDGRLREGVWRFRHAGLGPHQRG